MLTSPMRACLRRTQHPGRKRFLASLTVLCFIVIALSIVASRIQRKGIPDTTLREFPSEAPAIQKVVDELSQTCEGTPAAQQPYYNVKPQVYR